MTCFAFLKNFDPPPTEKESPDPVYTQGQIDTAQEKSFAQGIEQGRAETLNSLEQQLCELVQGFRLQVDDLYKQQNQILKKIYEEAQEIALCIATKHAQTEGEKQAINRCIQFVQSTLSCLLTQTPLSITVNPSLVDAVKDRLKNMDVQIQGDETLGVCATSLSWSKGGGYADFDAVQEKIADSVSQWLQSPPSLEEHLGQN